LSKMITLPMGQASQNTFPEMSCVNKSSHPLSFPLISYAPKPTTYKGFEEMQQLLMNNVQIARYVVLSTQYLARKFKHYHDALTKKMSPSCTVYKIEMQTYCIPLEALDGDLPVLLLLIPRRNATESLVVHSFQCYQPLD